MYRITTYVTIWLVLCTAAAARADRDIVYSARYYYPPTGPTRISHAHLYRINPDGSARTQLTFGSADDTDPVWSPDGKRVAFLRDFGGKRGAALCVMGENGGAVRRLARLPNGEYAKAVWAPDSRSLWRVPIEHDIRYALVRFDVRTSKVLEIVRRHGDIAYSPDGKHIYLTTGGDFGGTIRAAVGTKPSAYVGEPIFGFAWTDANTLVGSSDTEVGERVGELIRIGIDGNRLSAIKPRIRAEDDETDIRAVALITATGNPHAVVYVINRHNSTVGVNYRFDLVDMRSGDARTLVTGSFLAFSPDGQRYCTAPGRGLAPYGKHRTVWVAPLKVARTADAKPRSITPGTVWVTGADWRKSR